MLEKLRKYFNTWQEEGYSEEPFWYYVEVDERINKLTNVELLELIGALEEAQ